MANFEEPTKEQINSWNQWVSQRPDTIRELIQRCELCPWKLYRLKSSGHYVQLYSFVEGPPVTLTVLVLARWQLLAFERQVFGIDPDDLEECDLPNPDAPKGVEYRQEELTPEVLRKLGERRFEVN